MSIFKFMEHEEEMRLLHAKMTPDRVSYNKFKTLAKEGAQLLSGGYSSLRFNFQCIGEWERLEVVTCLTYLVSQGFEDETRWEYNNDVSVNGVTDYIMFKVTTVYSTLLLLVHDIESRR